MYVHVKYSTVATRASDPASTNADFGLAGCFCAGSIVAVSESRPESDSVNDADASPPSSSSRFGVAGCVLSEARATTEGILLGGPFRVTRAPLNTDRASIETRFVGNARPETTHDDAVASGHAAGAVRTTHPGFVFLRRIDPRVVSCVIRAAGVHVKELITFGRHPTQRAAGRHPVPTKDFFGSKHAVR